MIAVVKTKSVVRSTEADWLCRKVFTHLDIVERDEKTWKLLDSKRGQKKLGVEVEFECRLQRLALAVTEQVRLVSIRE